MASGEKSDSPLAEFNFLEESAEDVHAEHYGGYSLTGFPKPLRRYRLVYESDKASIEDMYYWVINAYKTDWGYGDIVKTVDTLAASEHSSFWGMIQQRKSIQQDRASQYLQTIGKMIQDLFKLVREIRILKERLALYEGVRLGRQADDIALKGYWVDMVEGGTKGQANIYTMAQQLGFGSLPDLFFDIFVEDPSKIDETIEAKASEFNKKVKEVLRRKLATYMQWRVHTEQELKSRHRFTLRYLRQHWATIRMYISWVKPYLKNVQRLEDPDRFEKNPELISSFEGAVVEIEFVARRDPKEKGGYAPTVICNFEYRVSPKMEFHADGYQHKGAVHVGRIDWTQRMYGWTEDDRDAYVRYRERESLELIGMVDQSVKDALDALGDELMEYLKEAGEDVMFGKETPKAQPPKQSLFEPFFSVFRGFKDIFSFPAGAIKDLNTKNPEKERGTSEKAMKAAKEAHRQAYQTYKNLKKQYRFTSW